MIYLDNAATTPVRREVLEVMWPYLSGDFGNPSSHHEIGEIAARALADARSTVAHLLGCRPGDVVFTSGGTEADNLAVKGIALGAPRGRHIVSTRIEHEAVLESIDHLVRLQGFTVDWIDVDASGAVDLDSLASLVHADTTLVSVAWANNEIGTVQPIKAVAEIAHASGVPIHSDAVQAAGWLDLTAGVRAVDALSISGHKLGAPKGIGAAYLRGRLPIEAVLHGGGQERERRSGTENVAGAVALATAMTLAEAERESVAARVTDLRDTFIASVLDRVPDSTLTGHPRHRLPGVASFVFPGTSGEAVLLELERRGVVCSSGSACAAGRDEPSHVLTAIGIADAVAQTAVRFTLSGTTTSDDIARATEAVIESVAAVASIR